MRCKKDSLIYRKANENVEDKAEATSEVLIICRPLKPLVERRVRGLEDEVSTRKILIKKLRHPIFSPISLQASPAAEPPCPSSLVFDKRRARDSVIS